MQQEKSAFLKNDMFSLFESLSSSTKNNWGKMNAQQMLEHLTDFFEVSTEKIIFELSVPEEHLPKYKAFLYSDKEFRENTKAPENVLGEEPHDLKNPDVTTALNSLRNAVDDFFIYFDENPGKTSLHPAFGLLNFDEWVLLHYKHVTHHLRQFGMLKPAITGV